MSKCEIDILSSQTNATVIKLPSRRFPGLLIQGDSLRILYDLAEEARGLLARSNTSDVNFKEASDVLQELESLLRGYLLAYESALKINNMQLPYTQKTLPDNDDRS